MTTQRGGRPDDAGWEQASAGLDAPFALLDLDALEANAADLERRAGRLPIRLASKSVRVRGLLEHVLARPGWRGVMSYSLREALWLAGHGQRDLYVAYPSTDRGALRELATDEEALERISLTIDSAEHVELLHQAAPGAPIRVVVDVDASLRMGPAHLGVRRSPIRTAAEAATVARVAQRAGLRVVGTMFYDAQIAGLPDSSPAIRLVKARSDASLRRRRVEVRAAVEEVVGRLEIVNGGGTGSLEITGADDSLTELAAGSGLVGPTLFDGYDRFQPRPALVFALPVVRRPASDIVTCATGGYIASGPPGPSRVPTVHRPKGLSLVATEGAGEVQTPLRGPGAAALAVGDRVWFRHAKAGELAERFASYHLVRGGELVGELATYRGEGRCFG